MTSIEYLGHSGLAVRRGDKLLLCDPWMSPTGAYNASWFPYPHYPLALEELQGADAIYISHEHLDHYDPDFLERFDRDTPILTGRVHKKRLVAKLRKSGFRQIVELDDLEAFELAPDFVVRVDTPTYKCPPHWFDSCALIEAGDRVILNLNDCNLALPVDSLRERGIDLLMAQASPAIWYPLVYSTYDEPSKARLQAQRRASAIESFMGSVSALRPRLAVPFAGPPIFFDPALAEHFVGEASMFPTPAVAAGQLAASGECASAVLNPGDRLILKDGPADGTWYRIDATPEYEDFDYERDRCAYYEGLRAAKEAVVEEVLAAIPEAGADLFGRFRRHLLPFLKGHPYFVDKIDIRVLFRITGAHGGDWVVDFRRQPDERLIYEWSGEHCEYEFEFASRYLDQVLRDEMSWEDLFLSLRFRAHRDPDRYNQYLFTLFKMHDHRALNAIMQAEVEAAEGAPETFLRTVDGTTYEIQRYCPHGGSDLKDAEIHDGHVICAGHHWRFSLETGACDTAQACIHVRRLDPATD